MKILRTDNLAVRIGGTVMGVFFMVVGTYALAGIDLAGDLNDRDSVLWFGITMLIGGLLAIGFAWLEPHLDQVYCAAPKRWLRRRSRRDPG